MKNRLSTEEKNYKEYTVSFTESHQSQKEYDELNIINAVYEKVCDGKPEIEFIRDNISERLRAAARSIAFNKRDSIEYTKLLESITDDKIQDLIAYDLKEFMIEYEKIHSSIVSIKKRIDKWEGRRRMILIIFVVLNIIGLTINSMNNQRDSETIIKNQNKIIENTKR